MYKKHLIRHRYLIMPIYGFYNMNKKEFFFDSNKKETRRQVFRRAKAS